jgi:type I restriction enzyme S subunit
MSNSIGKYIQLQGGFAFKSSDFRESGIPLIRISNVTENGLNKSDAVFLPEEFIDELKDFLLKENDTLIAMSGATTGKCCLIKSTDIPGFINQRVGRFRILNEKETDKLFVYHVVNSSRFKDELLKDAFGSAQPNVSPRDIENVKWYFPSFTEQQHIAKILSTADAVIEKTQAAIAKYKAIKQGMLQDLFTRGIDLNTNKLRPRYEDAPELYKESKLGMIPREWEVEKIGKIFRFNQGVQCPVELQKLHQGENEVRFIRIIDLTNEGEPPRYIADPGSQYHINSNDLFMVRYGSPGLVGYGYEGVIANNLFRIISTGELEILNSFYRYYLTSINDKLTALSASTTMPAINFDSLNKLHVIYPQIFEQVEIEKRIKAIDNKLQTEQNYLQKMQSLKKGLMEDLLCGKKQVKVAEEVLTQSEN